MENKWEIKELDEIVVINPTEHLKKGVKSKKIGMEKLQPYCRDIPDYEISEYSGGAKFRNGDTIMARITPCLENGKIAMVNVLEPDEVGFGSTEYIVFRAKENITTADFVYYLVCSSIVKEPAIKSMVGSSGRQRVQTDVIKKLNIALPPYNEQKKIGQILKGLDDKIKLNNEINSNLEQQAQAIFKSWFVDFEPYGGVMPFDWQVSTLGKISDMSAGGDKPDITSEIETENCRVPIYSNGITEEGLYGYTDKARIFDESVTVSARGTIGYVCLRQVPYVPIVRLISLIPKKELVSAKYLYLFLKQLHIAGTGTTQQQLTVPNFKGTEILIPTSEIMSKFTDVVNPFYEKILDNKAEIKKLCSLRDTLLPKLMSGEIDLSNISI